MFKTSVVGLGYIAKALRSKSLTLSVSKFKVKSKA